MRERCTIILILIIANFAGQYRGGNSCFHYTGLTLKELIMYLKSLSKMTFRFIIFLSPYSINTHHDVSTTKSFYKHCGKGGNCSGRAILLFPQCFLFNQIIVPHLPIFLTLYFYFLLNWNSPKLAYEIKC